jgi:hypothetical protein
MVRALDACRPRVRVAPLMTGEKRELSSAREAADALRRLASRVKDDPEVAERSAEALDELVRLADLLGRTVEDVAGDGAVGEESRAVRAYADELAAAIAAHREPPAR